MTTLTLRALSFGWALAVAGVTEETLFRSGAAAESAARRLARRMAAAGAPVELLVRLKDGSIGGRFFTPASVGEPAEGYQQAA